MTDNNPIGLIRVIIQGPEYDVKPTERDKKPRTVGVFRLQEWNDMRFSLVFRSRTKKLQIKMS